MAAALRKKKQIQRDNNLSLGEYTKDDHRHEKVKALHPETKNLLWRLEMFIMAFENLLFVSFVSGMTSGLPKN
eukprot:CAMPEP_0184070822 /NCGR_PEP_ID=MMETSP0957-20130417/51327_1 /TAXON_ID=627963 /ORGANISM="Aplanochytrium sp, Strain PBS07" /LENGTH=72 /DNA_ID=CAMNT_0026371017 /DNA_START=450 /DNA_END=668 /DNA_ORIENTATION=+